MSFKDSIQKLSILGGGQIVVILLGVVFYFGFAYILGPEKYGNTIYLISIATIIPTFSRFGLSLSVITFVANLISLVSLTIYLVIIYIKLQNSMSFSNAKLP